ncbi:DUF3592 domain-containing protein [Kribbella antibiotica]|uniref:DUF3592 domain-containing protein n=1 Tax=Kribbella antibiotica TaxID=190195 RepID=A0A4R4YRL4_9ACTN|nr:DUF3592 domain-containing protein [Kribbella antibiotica]TDD46984.1 DUF3592 domain-containing protein [Kribbella antibiotica]
MSWFAYWWVVPGGLAVLGYLLAFARLTPSQRAEWVDARIVDLESPDHRASKENGIPVTVAFRDPRSGQEFTLPNTDGKHGFPVRAAWVGRELVVHYPKGHPEKFKIALDGEAESDGRSFPTFMTALLLLGLVIHAIVAWGHEWAFLGFGALLFLVGLFSRDLRGARLRGRQLADAIAVPAHVVAVTTDVYQDGEGSDIINHAPVIAFTTTDGRAALVQPLDNFPNPGKSLGMKFTLHYAASDPTVYTHNLDFDRKDRRNTTRYTTWPLALGLAAMATGAVLLKL